MAVTNVGSTNPTNSASSGGNLGDYGFDFKISNGKVQITNTGTSPLKLDCISGAAPGGGFFPNLAEKPPLNSPIGVGQTVTVDVPPGWSGNFYRKTDGPEGKPSKEHPANLLEVTNNNGEMNWDVTAIDGANCAMSTTNADGNKVGIDRDSFKKMVSDAIANNEVIKDSKGTPVAIKAPTIGDGGDVSEADRIKKGYTTKDYYGQTSYVVDPQLEKLYRTYFKSSYILPDDDQSALFKN